MLVRLERCADGVERVAVRSICTKVHSIKGDRPEMTPETKRFSQSTENGADVCGFYVYNHIKDGYFNNAVMSV